VLTARRGLRPLDYNSSADCGPLAEGLSWLSTQREVDAVGVITISRGCFERCCSNKTTPPYHSNLVS